MFDELLGNDSIKEFLQEAISKGNLPQTLLFHGLDGIGKKLFAKSLAFLCLSSEKKLLLENLISWNHVDLHLLEPEGKASLHPINSIKSMIHEMALAPFASDKKVFIIDDADRMLPSSANALLKTLEEPLSNALIILLTSNIHGILPTILSRCVKLNFEPIERETIVLELKKRTNISEKKALSIGILSQGSLGYAIHLAKDPLYDEKTLLLEKLLDEVFLSDYVSWSETLEKMEKLYFNDKETEDDAIELQKKKDIEALFNQLSYFFRDLFLMKTEKKNFEGCFSKEFLERFSFLNVPLKTVLPLLKDAKDAIFLNLRLSHCLEVFFLRLKLLK